MSGAVTNNGRKNYNDLKKKLRRRIPIIVVEPSEGAILRGKKGKIARIVGFDYTDEESLKHMSQHTNTLKTADRDAHGGVNV